MPRWTESASSSSEEVLVISDTEEEEEEAETASSRLCQHVSPEESPISEEFSITIPQDEIEVTVEEAQNSEEFPMTTSQNDSQDDHELTFGDEIDDEPQGLMTEDNFGFPCGRSLGFFTTVNGRIYMRVRQTNGSVPFYYLAIPLKEDFTDEAEYLLCLSIFVRHVNFMERSSDGEFVVPEFFPKFPSN